MLRLRSEVGKGVEMDRHAVARFTCGNAGANVFLGKLVCKPRTRFDIAKVELYSVVPTVVAGQTANVLNVCVGKPGVAALLVAAVDPNPVAPAVVKALTVIPTDATVNNARLDMPRRVLMTLVDNAAADLVVAATVIGLDQEGKAATEVIANTVAGTGVKAGIARFKEIHSVVVAIVAGPLDALDRVSFGTVDEGVIATVNPDLIAAGHAPYPQVLLAAAFDIPADTPVWAQLVTDDGSVAAPFDTGVVVHWQPYIGAYDGEVAYEGYD
jgi:hypothetical protein